MGFHIYTAFPITHAGSFDTVHNISYDIAEETMQANRAGKSDHESVVHNVLSIKEDRTLPIQRTPYDHKKELEIRTRTDVPSHATRVPNSKQRTEASRVPTSLNLRLGAEVKKPARVLGLSAGAVRHTTKAPDSLDPRSKQFDIYSTPPPDIDGQDLLNSSNNPSPNGNRKLHVLDVPTSVIKGEFPADEPSDAEGDQTPESKKECSKYFFIPTKKSPAYNKLPRPAEDAMHQSTIGITSGPTPEPRHTMWTTGSPDAEGQDLPNSNNPSTSCNQELDSSDASPSVFEEELAIGSIDDQTPGSECSKDFPILTMDSPAYNKLPQPAEDVVRQSTNGSSSRPTPEPQHTMWTVQTEQDVVAIGSTFTPTTEPQHTMRILSKGVQTEQDAVAIGSTSTRTTEPQHTILSKGVQTEQDVVATDSTLTPSTEPQYTMLTRGVQTEQNDSESDQNELF